MRLLYQHTLEITVISVFLNSNSNIAAAGECDLKFLKVIVREDGSKDKRASRVQPHLTSIHLSESPRTHELHCS